MTTSSLVIVGAGHAGVQAAASLREEGWEGAITLLSDEAELPYQRPPLSKAFLKGQADLAGTPLRAEKFFFDNRIDLRRARGRCESIADRNASNCRRIAGRLTII
jgi:3-phenylpropionate/trans-cinnamate dioxygenase ferredoxin reductase subunit